MSREPIRFRNSLDILRCLKISPWGISRRFHRLSPWNGQVAHALRTLAPVAIKTSTNLRLMLPLDLHVLSLPLAFILSQDQTLHCIFFYKFLACPEPSILINFSKEINACTLFLVLINCTCSSLFQSTFPSRRCSSQKGPQRYAVWIKPPNFFCKNFSIFC